MQPGIIQVSVTSLTADGRFRRETVHVSAAEWKFRVADHWPSVDDMITRAAESALEAKRLISYAAGPKGPLP